MSTNYPVALDDSTTLPNPGATDKQNSPSHSNLHDVSQDAIKAVETKVGTGASTPVSDTFLIGNGTGTSAWSALTSTQLRARLLDETGTGSAVFATSPALTTPNLGTPSALVLTNATGLVTAAITDLNVTTGKLADSAVTSAKVAAGFPVQIVSTSFSAVATGTTQIPHDDTIPQITEGDEFMTLAITPKSATNILVIEASSLVANSGADYIVGAIFQDATAGALAADSTYSNDANSTRQLQLVHSMVAGTTSATTFRIRLGPTGANTITFNGASGARKFGAITKSFIKITEYKA